jgi:hypothetical protein
MAPRISTALSKAAAERRRNHQIPRKRPAHLPLPKILPTKIQKPVARPLRRKDVPHRQQLRGENRTSVPGNHGNSWQIRRILASRRKPSDPSVVEYKIQWDTSWEEASSIKGLAVEEWTEALEDEGTFTYLARDGSKWKVLKDETSGENDHEDTQWDMWIAIHRNVLEEVNKDWLTSMKMEAFQYADQKEARTATYLAAKHGIEEPSSALEALRVALRDYEGLPELEDGDILYGNVRVVYMDVLDPWYENDSFSHRSARSISSIVRLLKPNPFSALDVTAFTHNYETYNAFTHWRATLCTLIHTTPFMFTSGTWMQLFALLLLGGDVLKAELGKVGVMVQEDWPLRAREYAMHMYYEQVVDDRAPHDIQETYLCLREFFRELKPDVDEEKDVMVESVEVSDGSVSPRDVGQTNTCGSPVQFRDPVYPVQDDSSPSPCHTYTAAPPEIVFQSQKRGLTPRESHNRFMKDRKSEHSKILASSSRPQHTDITKRQSSQSVVLDQHFRDSTGSTVTQQDSIEKEKRKLFDRLVKLVQEEADREKGSD